jgi:hypothetical protein
MNESELKTKMVKSVRDHGGYARRIEDSFAVGTLDTILVPRGLPVFMAEVKMIRGLSFGPTPRQYIEMIRVKEAAGNGNHIIPVLIGWKNDTFYFHEPIQTVKATDCFSVTTTSINFHEQLVKYHYYRKGTT